MKKITLITAFIMLISFMSFADSWTETFDSEHSGSYGSALITIDGRDWTRSQAGNFSYANSTMGSYAFTINDDKVGANITTPVLNTCGTVSFQYAYKSGNSTNVFHIQKSTDAITWTDIDVHTLGESANLTYQDYSIDVNDASVAIFIRILSDNQNAHLFIENFSVTNYSGTSPTLTWSSTTFNEALANDGSIANIISLTLTNETFTTPFGQLVENTDYGVTNLPAGLTVSINAATSTTAIISISGNATSHLNSDDIANLTIAFLNDAFTGGDANAVATSSKTDLIIDFNDPPAAPELTWNQTMFNEAIANDGTIDNQITVTLTNETFATLGTLVSTTHYTATNVPAGLSVEITTTDANNATISLTGTATSHVSADNISNLTIVFENVAFTGADASLITNSTNNNISVNFLDAFIIPDLVITEIMYNPAETGTDTTEFIEIYNNDANPVNLNGYYLTGVTYTFGNITLNNGEYIVVSSDSLVMVNTFGVNTYKWTSGGLSNGGETITLLNPGAQIVDQVAYDDNTAWPDADGSGHSIVLCDATSDNNMPENWKISTNYVGMNANNSRMWASPMAADVVCSLTPTLTWNTTTFVEDNANDGSISTVIDLGLTDEEFATVGTLILATDYTVNNVPAGLTVEITSTSTTVATITLTGNATAHENTDDISNMEITFTDAAFVSGFAENVTNYSKMDLAVDFDDFVTVSSINENNGISIYPNPTTGLFKVSGNGIQKIEISDVTGKTIITSEINNFDLSKENNGIYFVKIYNNNSVTTLKLILNK